jgi:hypothetical protein
MKDKSCNLVFIQTMDWIVIFVEFRGCGVRILEFSQNSELFF